MKPKRLLFECDFVKKSLGVVLTNENDENFLMTNECNLFNLLVGLASYMTTLTFTGVGLKNISDSKKDEKDTSVSVDA